jgi:thioredoxin 1
MSRRESQEERNSAGQGDDRMSDIVRLTDKNFGSKVLDAEIPVLVEFWGSWCPPCKMMEPTLEQLAVDYEGRLKVGKINVDQNPRMASQYKIQGAPTFIAFLGDQVMARRTGAQSQAQLEKLLDAAGVFGSESESGSDEEDDEIRKRLRALGYVE